MKRNPAVARHAALVLLAATIAGCSAKKVVEARPPTTAKEKASYAMGVAIAKTFKGKGVEVDLDMDVLASGIRDELSNGRLVMTDEELRSTMSGFQRDLNEKQALLAKGAADANRRAGEAFLSDNAKKDGVVSLPSGLQYRVLTPGTGSTPAATDTVECNYRGMTVSGVEFDSSYARGRPAVFKVAGLIPGFREAIALMPVGSKWQLFIPPQLAYGERGMRGKKGAGRKIGPNATLVYEVELLAIRTAPPLSGAPGQVAASAGAAHTGDEN
jgi:FKBP-type peptidyl-prolyl cis-trans isomerase